MHPIGLYDIFYFFTKGIITIGSNTISTTNRYTLPTNIMRCYMQPTLTTD